MKEVIDQAIMDGIDRADEAFLLLLWQRPLESIPHYCELTKKMSDESQARLAYQHLTEVYGEGDCGLLHNAILKFQTVHPGISALSGDYIAEFITSLRDTFIEIRRILHQSLVGQIEIMTCFYRHNGEEPLLLSDKPSLSHEERLQRRDNRHIAIGIAQQQCDVVIQELLEIYIQKVYGASTQSSITLMELLAYRAEREEFFTQSYLSKTHMLADLDRERQDTYLIPDGERGEVRARAIREWITQVTTAPDGIPEYYQPLFDAAKTVCLKEKLEKLIADSSSGSSLLLKPEALFALRDKVASELTLADIYKELQYALEANCIWSNTRFGDDKETIFHLVSKAGNCQLLMSLSELARHMKFEELNFLDFQDKQGNTAFHAAMGADQYQCAITLIGFDVNLILCNIAGVKAYNACDSQGNGLAHYAVITNKFDWMSIIAATQEQPDDQSTLTVLDHILIQANLIGDTALHIAWRNNNFEATCVLLSYGANSRIANHRGEVPFKMLNNAGATYVIEAYRRNQKGLIDQFYDECPECITALNREGHTLLGLSLEQGDYDYAMHLIRRCNANFFDIHAIANIPVYQLRNAHDGATLLHHLVRTGAHTDAFYLIDQGADPSVEDGDGQPVYKAQDPNGLPIAHCAIKYRSYTSFVRLINAGVINPDEVNGNGDSLWTMLLNLVKEEQRQEEEERRWKKEACKSKKQGRKQEKAQQQKAGKQGASYKYLDFQKFITLIMVNYYEAQRHYKQEIAGSEDMHDVEYLLEPRSPLAFSHLESPEIDLNARVEVPEQLEVSMEAAASTGEEVKSPMDEITVHVGTGERQWSHLQTSTINKFGDIGDAEMSSNLKAWDRIRHQLITRDQCRKFLERKRAFLKQLISETCISTIVSHMAEDDLDLTQRLQAVSKQKNKNMPPALLHESRSLHFNATNIPGFGLGVDYRTMALRSKAETHRADMQTRRAEEQTRRAEEQARRAEEQARRAEEQTRRAETLANTLICAQLNGIGLVYQSQEAPEHGHQFYTAVAHYLGISTGELRERVKKALTQLQQDPPAALSQLFSRTPLTIACHVSQLASEVEVDADLESAILSFVLQRPILVLSLYEKIGVALADTACIDQLEQDPIFVFKHPKRAYFEGVDRDEDFEDRKLIRGLMLKSNTQKVVEAQTATAAVTTIGIFSNAAMVAAEAVTGANTKNTLSMQD